MSEVTNKPTPVEGLVALEEAARSLRTIADEAGRDEYLTGMDDVRGYANSRATVAEAALSAGEKGEAGGGEAVAAKPLQWQVEHSSPTGYREYSDSLMGFHITRDPSEPCAYRFCASWGEADAEYFPTLRAAKKWCQLEADQYVRGVVSIDAAQPTPGAVPDGLLERAREALRRVEQNMPTRRIPANPADADLVLAEVVRWLEGKLAPWWVAAATQDQESRNG